MYVCMYVCSESCTLTKSFVWSNIIVIIALYTYVYVVRVATVYEPKSQRTTWVLPDGICKAAVSKKKKSHFLGTNPGYTPPRITRTRDEEEEVDDDDIDYRVEEDGSLDDRVRAAPASLKIALVLLLVLCVVAAFVGFESNGVLTILSPFMAYLSTRQQQQATIDRDNLMDHPSMWKETPLVLRAAKTEPSVGIESMAPLMQKQVEESPTEQLLTDSKVLTHEMDETAGSVVNDENEVQAATVDEKEVASVGEVDIEEESVEETISNVLLTTNKQDQDDFIAVSKEEPVPNAKEQHGAPAVTDEVVPSTITISEEIQEEHISQDGAPVATDEVPSTITISEELQIEHISQDGAPAVTDEVPSTITIYEELQKEHISQDGAPAATDEVPSTIIISEELQEEHIAALEESPGHVTEIDLLEYERKNIETDGTNEATVDEMADSNEVEIAEMVTEQQDLEQLEQTVPAMEEVTTDEVATVEAKESDDESAQEAPNSLGESPIEGVIQLMDQVRTAMKTGEDLMAKIVSDAKSAGLDIDMEKYKFENE